MLNYRHNFNFVAECLGSGEPITEGLIREIHRRMVKGVREQGMDLTGRPECFVKGLAVQMELEEAKTRGTAVIRADVLARAHGLAGRSAAGWAPRSRQGCRGVRPVLAIPML